MIQEYRKVTFNESNFSQGKAGDRKEDADNTANTLPQCGVLQKTTHVSEQPAALSCMFVTSPQEPYIFSFSFPVPLPFDTLFCPEISSFYKVQHIRDSVSQGTPAKVKGADVLPVLSS